jgi:hypothetical protein
LLGTNIELEALGEFVVIRLVIKMASE